MIVIVLVVLAGLTLIGVSVELYQERQARRVEHERRTASHRQLMRELRRH